MPSSGNWYDRQATISKLLTYGAILILLASLATTAVLTFHHRDKIECWDLAVTLQLGAMALGGVFVAAVLAALSAVIDLMIVHAEALRTQGRR
jgi:hypothetical protein